jgi:chromosome segregation ATPase
VIDTDFLQQLESQINTLLRERKTQQESIAQLKTDLAVMKRQLVEAHVSLVELQKKYDNLLIAHSMIQTENGDVKRAKAKLTRMLETIDRCIGKLNA